jgi:ribonucleotide monophosphatase NagD (HAD superfamily)
MSVERFFHGYVLDLDGTVYLGDELLPGAKRAIEALRAAGSRVVFLSNKPLRTRADYAAKLTRLGVPTSPDEVINSSWVLTRWSKRLQGRRSSSWGSPRCWRNCARPAST